MIIDSSVMNLTSSHLLQETTTEQESLRYWTDQPAAQSNSETQQQTVNGLPKDIVDISDQAKQLSASVNQSSSYITLTPNDETKIRTLQAMIEAFTGKRFRVLIPRLDRDLVLDEETRSKLRELAVKISPEVQQRAGWGLDYRFSRMHSEQEQMTFSAEGIVKTADGREINLSLELNMDREFCSRQDIHLRAGDAAKIDPLVINFDAPAAALTTNKFSFDLDADGRKDNISFVKPGSGFLTLDLNKDGIVNDGKELFGPQSGNGFADLAAYDADGNNWIDENDPIWDQLRIWTKDASGNDVLFALGEKGVGAIYLGNVSTEFALKDTANQQQGQVRSSGLFLRENGTAGTVQQIDLVG